MGAFEGVVQDIVDVVAVVVVVRERGRGVCGAEYQTDWGGGGWWCRWDW